MSKEPTEKAQYLLGAVERRVFEDGHEALRRLLRAMIRHKEVQSLAEEIIQTEGLTQGWTSPLYCVCLDKSLVLYINSMRYNCKEINKVHVTCSTIFSRLNALLAHN